MSMSIEMTKKGSCIAAECPKCSHVIETHESLWERDINDVRNAAISGNIVCPDCRRRSPAWHVVEYKGYACRYSMPGYLDCTEWAFGKNRRELVKYVREMYG